MRSLSWCVTAAVAIGATAVMGAAGMAAADESPASAKPPARVVDSPVVAAPRTIGVDETPVKDAGYGSPDAAPLAVARVATPRPTPAPAPAAAPVPAPAAAPAATPAPPRAVEVPLRPINATCPVMVGMPVDSGCTCVWQGKRIAFCDAAARTRWESAPETFSGNLVPLLTGARIAPPVAGARLVSAPAPAGKATAPAVIVKPVATAAARPAPAKTSLEKPLAPIAPAHVPAGSLDPFAEGDECECKDGSCRIPLPR